MLTYDWIAWLDELKVKLLLQKFKVGVKIHNKLKIDHGKKKPGHDGMQVKGDES